MAHKVETMAYANQVPWHGLGNAVNDDLTPMEMLKAASLDWSVSKRELHTVIGSIPLVDHYGLVRSSDDKVLGICGKDYIPTQNEQAFEFFERFTKAGQMNMETAGSLDGGRHVWALAKLNRGFTLGGVDRVEGYLLLSSPHIWGKSLTAMFTEIRVVCNNTLTCALNSGGERFRMPHTKAFTAEVQQSAATALGLSIDILRRHEDEARVMSSAPAESELVTQFFMELFAKKTHDELFAAGANHGDWLNQSPRTVTRLRELYHLSPGSDLKTANGTWWGAFNSVTRFVDHEMGRDRDTSLTSAWFGPRAALKQKARTLAINNAKLVIAG
jgi:phage/plasmid-like protein (TIGR03299 family)